MNERLDDEMRELTEKEEEKKEITDAIKILGIIFDIDVSNLISDIAKLFFGKRNQLFSKGNERISSSIEA